MRRRTLRVELGRRSMHVRALLARHSEPLTLAEIVLMLDSSAALTRLAVLELVQQGVVREAGGTGARGDPTRYELTR